MNVSLLVIIVGMILVLGVGGYFFNGKNQTKPTETKPTVVIDTRPTLTIGPSITISIPPNWKTYTSKQYGFSIKYPADIKHDTNSEGERFYKLGKTQSEGTELYDGISLVIKTGNLGNQKLLPYIKSRNLAIKNDPIKPRVSEIREVTVAGLSGYAFDVTSLGDSTIIYLPKGETGFIEIINRTVEPQDRGQTFQQTVDAMLSTITFATES